DASRAVLERNRLRVEVLSAAVGPVEVRGHGNQIQLSKEHYLTIWLRVQRVRDGKEFAADVRGPRDVPVGRPRLRLTDAAGREFAAQDLDLAVTTAGSERRSAVFPVSVIDDVAVFEPPPPGVDALRLEVPADAWGGTGVFRFTIPRSMFAPP